MPYEELPPEAPSLEALHTLHGFASDVGADAAADLLMRAYWYRRTASYPLNESLHVITFLQIYDRDWAGLVAAGEPPLEDDDPRIGSVGNDACLPVPTQLVPEALYTPRARFEQRYVELEEREFDELRAGLTNEVKQAVGKVGLERVNELLGLLGVSANEQGTVTYVDMAGEKLEGVRRVARLMARFYRDFVRINPGLAEPEDLEAVSGTDIENPSTRAAYKAWLRALGIEQ